MKNNDTIKLEDFSFHHKMKTRWRDLDAFRHVNNATFLTYIEDARILFFKRWGINLKEKSLIVAAVKIDYIRQLEHPSNIISPPFPPAPPSGPPNSTYFSLRKLTQPFPPLPDCK